MFRGACYKRNMRMRERGKREIIKRTMYEYPEHLKGSVVLSGPWIRNYSGLRWKVCKCGVGPISRGGVSTEKKLEWRGREKTARVTKPSNNKTYSNYYTIMRVHFFILAQSPISTITRIVRCSTLFCLTELNFPFSALCAFAWKRLQSDPYAFPTWRWGAEAVTVLTTSSR